RPAGAGRGGRVQRRPGVAALPGGDGPALRARQPPPAGQEGGGGGHPGPGDGDLPPPAGIDWPMSWRRPAISAGFGLAALALLAPAPHVASVTPSTAVGSTLTVTIEGTGFDAKASTVEIVDARSEE